MDLGGLSKTTKNKPVQQQAQGQNILNQYFNQKKHIKYHYIESPKDSSIERVREEEMVLQEQASARHKGRKHEQILDAQKL